MVNNGCSGMRCWTCGDGLRYSHGTGIPAGTAMCFRRAPKHNREGLSERARSGDEHDGGREAAEQLNEACPRDKRSSRRCAGYRVRGRDEELRGKKWHRVDANKHQACYRRPELNCAFHVINVLT